MKKRFLLTLIATILFISIAFYSFAMDNVASGVRNAVGGTENVLEDIGNDTMVGMNTDNNNGNGYTATRTSSDQAQIAGMSTNTWTWIIMGITGVAIGILVWSYIKQRNKNDLYIDSDDL